MTAAHRILSLIALIPLAACGGGDPDLVTPGTAPDGYTGIAADETVSVLGTEPFWNGTIADGALAWRTAENAQPVQIAVTRFTGQGGIAFSGAREGTRYDIMVTPGACRDGMSDRGYPYIVTAMVDDRKLEGCGYTDRQPATQPEGPDDGARPAG